MPYGYHGKVLHVDLSQDTVRIEEPPEQFYRTYLGGSALGAYYALRDIPPGADPLGEANVLVLALSVLTGAPISGLCRMTAVAKSPLTGCIGDSQCGGFWPAELKFSGFDAIILRGRANRPVYLWICDGQAELRDAAHLWGKTTGEAEAQIKSELGDDKIEVLQIGPAGEKLVRYASLVNMSNRNNGRTGMGAVMGSKNLKAIAVHGSVKPPLAAPQRAKEIAQRLVKRFPDAPLSVLKYGSSCGVPGQQSSGGLPSFNWNSGVIDGADNLSGFTMYDTILQGAKTGQQDRLGRDTCFACTVRCKRVVEDQGGDYRLNPQYGGPEYETMGTLGTYCGVTDLQAVAYANQPCNVYGMDTISCGATIAWAMECFENGVIGLEETGGVSLRFGNAQAMVQTVEMIARRQGFGDILAEGSARAANKLGRGHQYLVTVKGSELPAHMPHLKRGLGLIYAVNPFGADHGSSEHDAAYEGQEAYASNRERLEPLGLIAPQEPLSLTPEKVRYARTTQHLYSYMDSANLCQFVFGAFWQLSGPLEMVEITQAVTGWDVTLAELLQVGERRVNMLRAFNAREGVGREADRLPDKLFDRPLAGGPTDGVKLDRGEYAEAIEEYYRQSGWDPATGYPTPGKLEELGLDWVTV